MSKIFIISGPSGVGKGSIINALMTDRGLGLRWVQTVTTREPRADDNQYGRHRFVNHDKFKEMISEGLFAEHNFYNNNYYGTPKANIEKIISGNSPAIMEIDVNGSENLKKQYPNNIVQIFVSTEVADIRKRLQVRGMPDNLIGQRIAIAKKETVRSKHFEYHIENKQGKLDSAVGDIKKIILGKL